jgi:HEAT repeat protein
MRKRLQVLIGVGVVVLFAGFIYWGNQTNHKLLSALSFEPTYEGETLNYWMDHWYQEYGHPNGEAEEAVRSMGTKAVPYLVKWIGRPCHSTADYDFCGHALKGFEVLGPTASPATPDLVKIIGRNGNFIACALGYIGTNAIPALTQKLLESVAATNEPPRLFDCNGHPTEQLGVQQNILESLSMMGTNAQSAMPVLISYLHNPRAREPGDAATVLAMAGHTQPDIVIPELIKTFSSSSGYVRADAADALATFGTNSRSAIPVLLQGEQDKDADTRAHIAVAIKQIAPETPNALEPVIQNLEQHQACQQTLYILGTLGTNGIDAVPALLECLSYSDIQIRIDTTRALNQVGVTSEEYIADMTDNMSCTNEHMRQAATETLSRLATNSKLAFISLIKKGMFGPIGRAERQQIRFTLINISRENPKFMLECLNDVDSQLRLGALMVFHQLEQRVTAAIPKLTELATSDTDADVRSWAATVLKLQLQ